MTRPLFRLRRPSLALALLGALGPAGAGCGPGPDARQEPYALPVDVFADTGRSEPLRAPPPAPPRAAAWLARVSPAPPDSLALPPADAPAETLALPPSLPLPAPPALVVDGRLKPPLPRTRSPLAVPAGARGHVELDVRVDEEGRVAQVRWAGGSGEPALVRAATECALAMRFFPAQRAGRAVAVWCRQRFDFGVPSAAGEP